LYHYFRKPAAGEYKSSLRIEPVGPNPDLCKGPDPTLLLKTYAERIGPNRANRKGPMVCFVYLTLNFVLSIF